MAISNLDITCTPLKLIQWKDPCVGSPWYSTYYKMAKGEFFSESCRINHSQKKILCNGNAELSHLRDAHPKLLVLSPSKGRLQKFVCLGVLTCSFRILRYFKVYVIFATKTIGAYHLLPHAHIRDTAFYPWKVGRKCACLPITLSGSGEVV